MPAAKNQPKKPSRGLGAIRADITPDVARDVVTLAKLFKTIAEQNPEAVKKAFGPYLQRRIAEEAESGSRMVQFYADNADYLIELFDYR